MSSRGYLQYRKLTFTLKEVRDNEKGLLEIVSSYDFSSHEAYISPFKHPYGVRYSDYQECLKPVVLRTKINLYDSSFLELSEVGMMKIKEDLKIYFAAILVHKFLYVRNYESNECRDFLEETKFDFRKQSIVMIKRSWIEFFIFTSFQSKPGNIFDRFV